MQNLIKYHKSKKTFAEMFLQGRLEGTEMMKRRVWYLILCILFGCSLFGCTAAAPTEGGETVESRGEEYSGEDAEAGFGKGAADSGEDAETGFGKGAADSDEDVEAGFGKGADAVSGSGAGQGDSADSQGENPVADLQGDTLEVHYLDVGQGDAIVIRQGDSAMLIDAGDNSKGTAVWSYLLSQNIDHLDYAVGTHPDADHIGGLDVVLYKTDCNLVLLPEIQKDTRTCEELLETIEERGQSSLTPELGQIFQLGKAQFQVLTDTAKDYGDNTNDYSIALRLTFGDSHFLFTGDGETAAEADMLQSGLPLQADVYKASHHGADTANTEAFLEAVNPDFCVISCGEGNSYGHPRAAVLNRLRAMGVKVFRTDEQGTIVAVSDGEQITFNTSPSDSWKAGEPVGSAASPESSVAADSNGSGAVTYILNTGTKKFHLPDCSSVAKMADKNKQKSSQSREELILAGYEPCKNCNP